MVWFRGRVARQRSAKPFTAVRIRSKPRKRTSWISLQFVRFFFISFPGNIDDISPNAVIINLVSFRRAFYLLKCSIYLSYANDNIWPSTPFRQV
jgi:hypothetical protein